MSDLAAWLLQQITDDETAARAATTLGYGWDADGLAGDVYASGDDPQTGTVVAECGDHEDAEHIARWDPARVLAECEAKRRLLAVHEPSSHQGGPLTCSTCCQWDDYPWRVEGDPPPHPEEAWPCLTVRLLAVPNADRPGYLEEWQP